MAIRSAILVTAFLCSIGFGETRASGPGDNVVVIDVDKVLLPAKLPGDCRVNGFVDQVRLGSAFHIGQAISLAVPCGAQARLDSGPSTPSPRGVFRQDVEVLKKSRVGLARLNDAGQLIWQPAHESYGTFGSVIGYRVMGGAVLPIGPVSTI